MRYAPDDCKEIAAAFRAAKPYLWDGSEAKRYIRDKFICWALAKSRHPASALARQIVTYRLGRYPTIDKWLVRQGVHASDLTDALLQAHRRAWVDLLIAEFEAAANKKVPEVASIAPNIVTVSPVGQKVKTVWL